MDEHENNNCSCGSNLPPHNLYDGYGIFLRRVCDKCEEDALSGFRKDIFERYECDEAIEPEDY